MSSRPVSRVGGYYRWFRSENVIALEKYRDGTAMARIRTNILSKGWRS